MMKPNGLSLRIRVNDEFIYNITQHILFKRPFFNQAGRYYGENDVYIVIEFLLFPLIWDMDFE